MKRMLVLLAMIAAIAGCRAESRKLEAPLTPYSKSELKSDRQTYDLTPKVDILIVVDYSTSMGVHQANLAANIEQFVNEFSKNALIDYHIGVLPMYDHVHCMKAGQAQMIPNGFVVGTCYPFGELLPLKNPEFKAGSDKANEKNPFLDGPRFVTKSTVNGIEALKRTILVGEKPGPAYEEMFSPVLPALSQPELVNGANKDFYRGEEATLITVYITDGDDSDGPVAITSGKMYSELLDLKKGNRDKIDNIGVLSLSTDGSCAKDQSAPSGPKKMEDFINRSGGKLLSLCSSNFGKKLAKIGEDISVKVGRQVITLKNVPDMSKTKEFEIYFGTQKLKRARYPDFENGWQFDPETQTIFIGSKTQLNNSPDSKLRVEYTPVTLSSAQNGKVQTLK